MTNRNLKNLAPYIAALAAVGVATAAAAMSFTRTSKALKELGNLDLDFGNDEGILSMFKSRDAE